jgi:hypothetical protein
MAKPYVRQRPVSPQLQFPWSEPPSLPQVPLPDAPHVLPTHLWTSLSPTTRSHVRHILCRIREEVLNERTRP